MKEFFADLNGDKWSILIVCALAFMNELMDVSFSFSGAISVAVCAYVVWIGYRVFTDKSYENWHGTR